MNEIKEIIEKRFKRTKDLLNFLNEEVIQLLYENINENEEQEEEYVFENEKKMKKDIVMEKLQEIIHTINIEDTNIEEQTNSTIKDLCLYYNKVLKNSSANIIKHSYFLGCIFHSLKDYSLKNKGFSLVKFCEKYNLGKKTYIYEKINFYLLVKKYPVVFYSIYNIDFFTKNHKLILKILKENKTLGNFLRRMNDKPPIPSLIFPQHIE